MTELQKAPWSDWETVRLIGRGSFGTVYEIQRKLVDEDTESAALKVITIPQNPGDVEEMYSEGYDDESITATFNSHLKSIVAEYSLMRKMDGSANIVNCKDIRYIQHDDGIGWDIYIRMELLTPLTKALPVDADEATIIRIGKDICNALVLCKKHEIVHRDIKPQNIFVSSNGDYKLGDFGIAKTVERTMGGTKIGTYKYMAPEVYNNQPYGSAADIYSMGLVLYWLLNERRMPFMPLPPAKLGAGMDEEVRHRRLSGEKLPEPAHGSAALKQIVLKACAYDPKDRYSSAAAMLEDLNKLTGGASAIPPVIIPDVKNDEKYEDDKTTGPVFDTAKKAEVGNVITDDSDETVGPSFIVKPSPVEQPKEETAKTTDFGIKEEKQKSNAHKYLFVVFSVVIAIAIALFFLLRSCDDDQPIDNSIQTTQPQQTIKCAHNWTDATCTSPATCLQCNETSGVPDGHKWNRADYFTPKVCSVCGITEGRSREKSEAVTAGAHCTVVLKADGTVVLAGTNTTGYQKVASWTGIVAISAGGDHLVDEGHIVGLKADGTVMAAGNNKYGQCNVNSWTDVVAISAGHFHTVGLKADGTVVAVGNNFNGQCDVNGWENIVAISAGGSHTVGLKADGTVVTVGEAIGYNLDYDVSDWTDVVAVSAGGWHTVGLKTDGTVVAVGDNDFGQCNVEEWTDIVAVSAAGTQTLGLKADGTVVAVGNNGFFQCNVSKWKNIVAIDAGPEHSIGVESNGAVVAVGRNDSGQCMVSSWERVLLWLINH